MDCPYGCGWKGSPAEYSGHYETCSKRPRTPGRHSSTHHSPPEETPPREQVNNEPMEANMILETRQWLSQAGIVLPGELSYAAEKQLLLDLARARRKGSLSLTAALPEYIARARDRIEITLVTTSTFEEEDVSRALDTCLKRQGWHKAADKRNPNGSYTMYWLVGVR